jgi:hypothetical protein
VRYSHRKADIELIGRNQSSIISGEASIEELVDEEEIEPRKSAKLPLAMSPEGAKPKV